MASNLGRTLLIANPTSQSGKGAAVALRAATLLEEALGAHFLSLVFTSAPGEAVDLAASTEGCSTVIVLGGDGTIHEVANGLMRLPKSTRPALGVLPVGSGNDYARTLGMSLSLDTAVNQVLSGKTRAMDVGCCNGVYFVETFSFGFDAAIAIDVMKRRKRTGRSGTMLYLASGVNQLLRHLTAYRFRAVLDGKEVIEGAAYQLAIQIGATYGGGFHICPDACVDDGLFDLCVTRPPLNAPRAMYLFLRAKNGQHTKFKQVSFYRASSIQLSFYQRPPIQVDGEPLLADACDVAIKPKALRVLTPLMKELK